MSQRTVKDLVPGDPKRIWLLADSYNRMARLCEDVGHSFRGMDDGGWTGQAAEAFHARFERQPKRVLAMADSYHQVAVALDTYASTLHWAQRQAGEVIALEGREEPERRPTPVLTTKQQAEVTGVITATDGPEPVRGDQRAQAVSTYRRALAMLDSVGNDSAASIRIASGLIPEPVPVPTPSSNRSRISLVLAPPDLVRCAVLRPPTTQPWFDPALLSEDDPRGWESAIKALRKRLRWDGLDRLSPRLAQHIFHGHYRRSKDRYTGYHHREGGLDRGALRVVKVIAGPDTHGVYKAQVAGPESPANVTKLSMFFPDSWSRAEVLHAVRVAFLDALRNDGYDPVKRRFRGMSNGVLIEGHVKSTPAEPRICDIVTAYPRSVVKQRE